VKITKLGYQKKDPNRVNVYIDDQFAVGLEVNDIVTLGLYKDQEISQEQLKKIIGESEFGKLFNSALNFISFRPRSEWEIRHKLKFKTKDSKLIDNVIEKLKKIDQVNDLNFAKWFVDQRQTFRSMGQRGIKYELLKKGIDRKTTESVFTVAENMSDAVLASRLIEKMVSRLKAIDYDRKNLPKTKAKLQRFLSSRGFGWETIEGLVEKSLKKGYTTQG